MKSLVEKFKKMSLNELYDEKEYLQEQLEDEWDSIDMHTNNGRGWVDENTNETANDRASIHYEYIDEIYKELDLVQAEIDKR
jgi:hypothetical protein